MRRRRRHLVSRARHLLQTLQPWARLTPAEHAHAVAAMQRSPERALIVYDAIARSLQVPA